MKKVAIYVRVSTTDKGQDVENQIVQLKEFCKRRDFEIIKIYQDNETGKHGRKERKAFDQMFKDAHKAKFEMLIIWALDRFSRQGPQMDFNYLKLLDDCGVRFHSYTQEFLSTENELIRNILIALMSSFAKYEREMISVRTKAGLERAKKNGVKLGRKGMDPEDEERLLQLLKDGISNNQVAEKMGIHRQTVLKKKKKFKKEGKL